MLVFSSLYNAFALTQRPGIIWSRKKYHSSCFIILSLDNLCQCYGKLFFSYVTICFQLYYNLERFTVRHAFIRHRMNFPEKQVTVLEFGLDAQNCFWRAFTDNKHTRILVREMRSV
jgi:hypothetical protein